MEEPNQISKDLLENLVALRGQFENCMDFMMREFCIGENRAALAAIDGLVNKQIVAQGIMNPILGATLPEGSPQERFSYIRDHALPTVDQVQIRTLGDVTDRIFSGFVVLLMDGCDWGNMRTEFSLADAQDGGHTREPFERREKPGRRDKWQGGGKRTKKTADRMHKNGRGRRKK